MRLPIIPSGRASLVNSEQLVGFRPILEDTAESNSVILAHLRPPKRQPEVFPPVTFKRAPTNDVLLPGHGTFRINSGRFRIIFLAVPIENPFPDVSRSE